MDRIASQRPWPGENRCPCFINYCAQKLTLSSITRIAWPFDADQPPNAVHLTLNLDVAFELTEVRTGLGLKPLHRGVQPTGTIEAITAELHSVLQMAWGAEGERKRRNAESMRYQWKKEWQKGGDALKNLSNFLTKYCGPMEQSSSRWETAIIRKRFPLSFMGPDYSFDRFLITFAGAWLTLLILL